MQTKMDEITFKESKNKTQNISYTDIDANATEKLINCQYKTKTERKQRNIHGHISIETKANQSNHKLTQKVR